MLGRRRGAHADGDRRGSGRRDDGRGSSCGNAAAATTGRIDYGTEHNTDKSTAPCQTTCGVGTVELPAIPGNYQQKQSARQQQENPNNQRGNEAPWHRVWQHGATTRHHVYCEQRGNAACNRHSCRDLAHRAERCATAGERYGAAIARPRC